LTSSCRLALTQLTDRALLCVGTILPVVVAFSNALAEIASFGLLLGLTGTPK